MYMPSRLNSNSNFKFQKRGPSPRFYIRQLRYNLKFNLCISINIYNHFLQILFYRRKMSATPLNIDQLVDDNADVSFQGTNPMINELMIIFRNEVHCPEILEYKFDLMDSILASLQRQIVRKDA